MNFFDGTSAVKFWEYADTYERANSVVYREMELNIPNEFNHEQAKTLISNFVKKELGEGFPYTYAIHESFNKEGEKNLHCHLMFSERENDGINRKLDQFFKRANSENPALGGAMKNRQWQEKSKLLELRKSWEIESNNLLEKYGFEARVDCRSLREIRRELLEREMFDQAEKYNRVPLNISGKILYKVDRNITLTDKEQEKYDNFLEAKRIRLEKIKKVEKKDLKAEIQKLEKQNSNERALNIISKGKYFKLKKELAAVSKKIKNYPENSILSILNGRKKSLNDEIEKIKNSVENSIKYKNIVEQLERNRIRDLAKAKELFMSKFNENYESKDNNKENEKTVKKYKKKDKLRLKIEEQILLNENSEEKAINVITDYKYNAELVDNFNLQDHSEKLKEKYNEAALYNQEELKNIKVEILENDYKLGNSKKNILELLESIDEEKLKELSEKIQKKDKFRLYFVREEIKMKGNLISDLDYEKERLALLYKHSNLEKLYNKENVKDMKDNKKMYNLSSEIVAIENLLNTEYKESKSVEKLVKENIEKINNKIEKNNNRIKVAQENINKIEIINKVYNNKHNLRGIEIIVIGRLSKNEYWRLGKEQEKLKKEIEQKEKVLKRMSLIAFGKNVLKKSLELSREELKASIKKENILVEKYTKHLKFKSEVKTLEEYYERVIKDNRRVIFQLKQENKISYQLKSNIQDNKKEVRAFTRLPQRRLTNKNTARTLSSLKNNIHNILAADSSEIRSNLDINLKREKEYEWEM
ncbi:MAG: MobA/MobL family protein [Fusobacterium sp.]|uniref:MobA/MobL family protein n=1 Tax=Fusobacterium sp. TaxID=68766 RepID=UPI0026DD72D4|nr:MobA/MobL family protein [Fusobacterium sp.]MDO4689823.1 MobA/MobL family protein [Fusobacterium sp.]